MFVDPKITLTRRVTDPADTIRKARVLLDQHLRQDAAYNRQVSRSLYFIGPDVTCQITHEFNQTYIALDQKAAPSSAVTVTTTPYRFLNVLTGTAYLTAWLSRDGNSWTQVFIPPLVANCLQSGSGVLTQISKTMLFLFGQFDSLNNGVGWALVDSRTLSASSPQGFAALNGNPVLQAGAGAFVGGSVLCLTLRTSAGSFLAWYDYIQNQYLYVLPYATLGLPDTSLFFEYIRSVALTRGSDKNYAPVAFGAASSGVTALWTADVNTQSFSFLGEIPVSFTGGYFPELVAGASGQFTVAIPSASGSAPAIQTGTDFYTLAPAQGAAYSTNSYTGTNVGLWYTPVGWAADFAGSLGGLFFFSAGGALGTVSRPSTIFANLVVAVNGIYDVMGGGFYNSPAQKKAVPLGLPPYSDPNSPAYALNTLGLTSQAFYLGTPIMPWLNLY